jgi:metal-sulfur cluster biosynthetic enzyme
MIISNNALTMPDDLIEAEAWERLTTVYDPEVGLNLVDLGLIYELASREGHIHVVMTLTTPGCPMSDSMPDAVQRTLETIPGVKAVDVDLVWAPPWTPERISEAGLRELGWLD